MPAKRMRLNRRCRRSSGLGCTETPGSKEEILEEDLRRVVGGPAGRRVDVSSHGVRRRTVVDLSGLSVLRKGVETGWR